MTIFELLETTGKPYFRYGTVPAETVRDFYTFQQIDARALLPTDNEVQKVAPVYDIVYYTDAPENIYNELIGFLKTARKDNWTILEYPIDIECREPNLFGRLARITKIEYNEIRA